MRMYFILALCVLGFTACRDNETQEQNDLAFANIEQQDYKSFGEEISLFSSLTAREMKEKYQALAAGDTITAKFSTTVNSVCKMKGCWMTLDLPDTDEDPMVKFKDYGFFVPKDIEGKQVIVEGIAFMEETSVEDQKHYAKDAGKSKEEVEAISRPLRAPGFLAHGVLIKL